MNTSPADPNSWVEAIANRFRENPHSSDSAEGIARWWLRVPVSEWPRVRRALEILVSEGRLERIVAADGRERYRLPLPTGTNSPDD
jgi:hypothetical protein